MRYEARAAITLLLVPLVFACSLKKKEQPGLRVNLSPQAKAARMPMVSAKLFNAMAASTPNDLDDLNCFGVNIHSGTVASTDACYDNVEEGKTEGMLESLSSSFDFLLPTGNGYIFEAFGAHGVGACSDLSEVFDGAPLSTRLYRIGEMKADITNTTDSISIPVDFDAGNAMTCNATPFTVIEEDFNSYSNGELGNGVGNSAWIAAAGASGFTILSNTAYADSNTTFTNFATTEVDSGLKVKITADIAISGGPAGINWLAFGLSNQDTNYQHTSGGEASLGCAVVFNSTLTQPYLVTGPAGAPIAPVGPSGSGSAPIANINSSFSMTCEIAQVGGQYQITNTISDGTNTLTETKTAPLCSPDCSIPYFFAYRSGSTINLNFDAFKLQQSN